MSTSSAPPTRLPRFLSGNILLPLIIIFGYVAFLITGIDAGRNGGPDDVQPIALYIYFSLLLVLLQLAISEDRSWPRILYIFVASGFAIIYAGERLFNAEGKRPGNFTSSPWTYIIINVAADRVCGGCYRSVGAPAKSPAPAVADSSLAHLLSRVRRGLWRAGDPLLRCRVPAGYPG